MKAFYKLSLLSFVILAMTYSMSGQRVVVVPGYDPTSGESVEDYNNILYDTIVNDTVGRETEPNTIYELKRGHIYPQGKIIKNYDYKLHIRAEEGDGVLPQVIVGQTTLGTYGSDYIRAYNDLTLEDIYFSAYCPDGSWLNRMVETYGNKSRYEIKGCMFDGDRGAGIVVRADSMTIIVEDVIVGNTGYRKAVGGNGRILDFRPEALYCDTLIIRNSTVCYASDRIIRNMNTVVNYLEIDHLTALNNSGFNGALQLGVVNTAIVTNNLLANTIGFGHVDSRATEMTQPEQHFSVISIDTVFDAQEFVVRNNNIYTDQVIEDVWAKYDSVSAPWAITPTIEAATGTEVSDIYFVEPLVFTETCSPRTDYIDAYFIDPNATEFPDAWCVGGDGGYFLDEADLSYPSSTSSYSAGDKGYPVGNLNYFPALKAVWETGADAPVTGISESYQNNLISIYPNPANNGNVSIELNGTEETVITIMDVAGKILLQDKTSGSNVVNVNIGHLNSGIYFLRVDSDIYSAAKTLVVD